MTSLNFDARYQLLKCVAVADGIRTHNALETVTGRVVMVHLVDDAGPEEVEALQSKLGRLDQSDKVRILEVATVHAGFAVVTEFLQGLVNFSDWLDARAQPAPEPLESSDVTGRSVAALREQASELSSPESSADTSADPFKHASADTTTRGDTAERLVVGSGGTVRPPSPLSPAAMPASPPLPPGEFTSMFGAQPAPAAAAAPQTPAPPVPAVPPAPPVPSTPAPELQPGEFTRLFHSAASGSAPQVETPPAPTPSPLASMGQRLGTPDAARQGAPSNLPAAGGAPARPVSPLAPASGASGAFSSFPSFPPLPSPTPPPPSSGSSGSTPAAPPPSPVGGSPFGLPPSPSGRPPEPASREEGGSRAASHASRYPDAPPAPRPSPAAAAPSAPPPRAPSADPLPLNASPLGADPLRASPLGAASHSSLPPLPPLPPVLPAPVFGHESRSGVGSPAGAARAESTPGVYTQLIQQSVTPAPVVAASTKPATLPTERKRSIPLGLIVALNVVLLLAIVLVLYFVFRPAAPAALPGEGVPAPGSIPGATAPAVPNASAIPKPTAPAAPALPVPKR